MPELQQAREAMVKRQIAARGVRDPWVLDAMGEVPRELFVAEGLREAAYDDRPLPIGSGQTISQPYIVALMLDAARLKPGDRVLEVGAGSGYAAAVMARIAAEVYAIERHAELARQAQDRFNRLSYENIHLRSGDGSLGWPEAAPFDVIVVSAGGPAVPKALKRQLAIGGRLVMPIGDLSGGQRLVRLTRTGEDAFDELDLGAVTFVPLVGAQGWGADQAAAPQERPSFRPPADASIQELIRQGAERLPDLGDTAAFGRLFERFGDARVVLLGESTHGTSEFYLARGAITRWLVESCGFDVVALEADWPDAASLDRLVRHRPRPAAPEPAFSRFPSWMWRNREMEVFTAWLRDHNRFRPEAARAGIYGLDLYSLGGSIRAVTAYLDRVDPEIAALARDRYACLSPWAEAPQGYGRKALADGFARCEAGVTAMLLDLMDKRTAYAAEDGDDWLEAAGNARLVKAAEGYYRAMYHGAAESWNLRDRHMFDSLEPLLAARGPDAKAVVWAHNSHIGDARFTEMGARRGELNLGQLCRERWGEEAVLIGFGTAGGTVAAADDWDGPMRIKPLGPPLDGSYEALMSSAGCPACLLDLKNEDNEALRYRLLRPRPERFIGVVYRPETERWSHYSDCSLPQQFDAFVWFETTRAVTPTAPPHPEHGPDETWPFGV
jgi:protein-L-isoaspartate(D-aspartate) O-methyltransferase